MLRHTATNRIKLLSASESGRNVGTARIPTITLFEQAIAWHQYGSGDSNGTRTICHTGFAARSQYASYVTDTEQSEKKLRPETIQMLDMRQRFQTKKYAVTTRAHTHRFKTVRMSRVRQTFPTTIAFNAALADPCQRETIFVCVLSSQFSTTGYFKSTSPHPFG